MRRCRRCPARCPATSVRKVPEVPHPLRGGTFPGTFRTVTRITQRCPVRITRSRARARAARGHRTTSSATIGAATSRSRGRRTSSARRPGRRQGARESKARCASTSRVQSRAVPCRSVARSRRSVACCSLQPRIRSRLLHPEPTRARAPPSLSSSSSARRRRRGGDVAGRAAPRSPPPSSGSSSSSLRRLGKMNRQLSSAVHRSANAASVGSVRGALLLLGKRPRRRAARVCPCASVMAPDG